jgi:hypothetical protein
LTTDAFPEGYAGMTRLQVGRKKIPLIKKSSIQNYKNIPAFYHLPDVAAPGLQNFQHEKICEDHYVAYQTTGELHAWYWKPHEEYKRFNLVPDRSSIIGDKIVFWEIDRGTESLSEIEKKIPKYIELANVKQKKFHVVISVPTKGRAKNLLLDVLPQFKRGNQFVVTTHELVLSNPLGEVFASPIDPSRFLSILNM